MLQLCTHWRFGGFLNRKIINCTRIWFYHFFLFPNFSRMGSFYLEQKISFPCAREIFFFRASLARIWNSKHHQPQGMALVVECRGGNLISELEYFRLWLENRKSSDDMQREAKSYYLNRNNIFNIGLHVSAVSLHRQFSLSR